MSTRKLDAPHGQCPHCAAEILVPRFNPWETLPPEVTLVALERAATPLKGWCCPACAQPFLITWAGVAAEPLTYPELTATDWHTFVMEGPLTVADALGLLTGVIPFALAENPHQTRALVASFAGALSTLYIVTRCDTDTRLNDGTNLNKPGLYLLGGKKDPNDV